VGTSNLIRKGKKGEGVGKVGGKEERTLSYRNVKIPQPCSTKGKNRSYACKVEKGREVGKVMTEHKSTEKVAKD